MYCQFEENSLILIFVLFSFQSFTLIFCLWLKRKIFLVLVFHFDFPANVYFFDFSSSKLYTALPRILCCVGVSRKGALRYLVVTVMCP